MYSIQMSSQQLITRVATGYRCTHNYNVTSSGMILLVSWSISPHPPGKTRRNSSSKKPQWYLKSSQTADQFKASVDSMLVVKPFVCCVTRCVVLVGVSLFLCKWSTERSYIELMWRRFLKSSVVKVWFSHVRILYINSTTFSNLLNIEFDPLLWINISFHCDLLERVTRWICQSYFRDNDTGAP